MPQGISSPAYLIVLKARMPSRARSRGRRSRARSPSSSNDRSEVMYSYSSVLQSFMIETHGNPGLQVVHRFPLLREDMNVSVAPKGTSHRSTIAYASLLRGRCHLRPASARHSGRKPPGQRDGRLVPGTPFQMYQRTSQTCASVTRLGHQKKG